MIIKKEVKKYWDKFWFLLWKDDSFKGWLFSIIFIFIFIKFIFFPLLSLLTGTVLPLAIVESCSMYHEGNLLSDYNSWFEENKEKYSNFDIEKEEFREFIFTNGFNKADILLILGANTNKLKVGDVIIFTAGTTNPVIHRIVEIDEQNGKRFFSTMGDNNDGQLNFEKNISEDRIIGKAVFKLMPYIGWVKLVFFEWQKSSSEKGFCD
jgi:signal peptidase I